MITTKLTIQALNIAEEAHRGQVDKTGAAYIAHPIAVASQMDDEISTCVALLHDVLEDTEVSESDLKTSFPEQVVDAVVALTRRADESYADYILRVKKNAIARKVKIADLTHNLQEDRLSLYECKDAASGRTQSLRGRYEKALKTLLGDEELCERCRNCTVDGQMKIVCSAGKAEYDERQALESNVPPCDRFDCRYIQYPLTINAIEHTELGEGLYECGQPVCIRPVSSINPDDKTYFGILIGELMYHTTVSFNRNSRTLRLIPMTNPAIYVPALKKIVFGYESWWARIKSEDDLREISDKDIRDQWYIKILQDITDKGGHK